jgi:GNAT superfamily N-acetyltransferase
MYAGAQQVAFARVVSDRSRFSYLCDVFVVDERRGQGLGRALIDFVLAHPSVRGTRRVLLGTRDAHPFYERMGWQRDAHGRFMELVMETPST